MEIDRSESDSLARPTAPVSRSSQVICCSLTWVNQPIPVTVSTPGYNIVTLAVG